MHQVPTNNKNLDQISYTRMANIREIFREIHNLLDQLDEDDFEFDAGGDVSPIRPQVRRRPRSGARPSRRTGRPSEKHGREKFEARRKVKRLNRLLKKAEREGYDIANLIESGRDRPLVRVVEETIYVDRPGAELDWKAGESSVIVEVDDEQVPKELPFTVESVRGEGNGGITVFHCNNEA